MKRRPCIGNRPEVRVQSRSIGNEWGRARGSPHFCVWLRAGRSTMYAPRKIPQMFRQGIGERKEVMDMRRALSLTVALLLAGGLAAPAFAQATPQVIISHEMTNEDLNTAELAAFDQVATSNLKMSRRLAANPRLVNSDSFLRRWPDLN